MSELLLNTFRSDDFDFKQLAREGMVALFRKSKANFSHISYEVVIIQKRDAVTWPNGLTTPAHEAMPSSRDWGKYGWTLQTLEDAESRFKALVERQFEEVALGHN